MSNENPAITDMIEELNSLHDGERALVRIIAAGPAAIPFLKEFLLFGRPSGVYQPRRWAVEALAALGAKEALMEYLAAEREISDPVVRLGEEAVENAAARALAGWGTDEVFDLLTRLASHRLAPGFIDALGTFRRAESIPIFDRALEDDLAREPAEKAFRELGKRAADALSLSARTLLPSARDERPSSLLRRTSAVGLLLDVGARASDWPELEPLLQETDPHLVLRVAQLAVRIAPRPSQIAAGRAVLRILPDATWDVRMEAAEMLPEFMPELHQQIETEIARRSHSPSAAYDRCLPVLMRALRLAAQGH
jgi:hypothetical protein